VYQNEKKESRQPAGMTHTQTEIENEYLNFGKVSSS
jgi:hypothetical protein